jgi:hypothetical protein
MTFCEKFNSVNNIKYCILNFMFRKNKLLIIYDVLRNIKFSIQYLILFTELNFSQNVINNFYGRTLLSISFKSIGGTCDLDGNQGISFKLQ